jgi:DNA-binding NarL/FixJ family response regulator
MFLVELKKNLRNQIFSSILYAIMPRKKGIRIRLTPKEKAALTRAGNKIYSWQAKRYAIVSLSGQGYSDAQIADELRVSLNTIRLWQRRYAQEGIKGLLTRPIPGRPKTRSRIV